MAEIKQNKMTQEGYDALVKELDYLKGEKRKEIAERIKVARSYGDLSENSEYDDAMNDQGLLERKIKSLEESLKNAVVVQDNGQAKRIITGHTVRIFDQKNEKEYEYKIVGPTEANPKEKKISNESPIGAALIDHKKGDTVNVETPSGVKTFKVLEIIKG